ncbi:MAG TPA: GGDEF domain-containing protein [Vicinamibacterales bacterium]|nr:GGDEF domain-containing protein [Vicinamibacterales bacterium]
MRAAERMLIVADGPVAVELSGRLGRDRSVCCGDSYDALWEMSRRRWSAVVIAAPRDRLEGFCRAARRLQDDAGLFAVCPPAAEPDVRAVDKGLLDDYFIYPPTDRDVNAMLGAAEPEDDAAGRLSCRQFVELAEAARNVAEVEARVAEMVAGKLGPPVRWHDADRAPADRSPLLLSAGERPRVLVPAGPIAALGAEDRRFLDSLQRCLPPLLAIARRTESLHRLAITDHLTGAYNRRYFYHLTDRILSRPGPHRSRETLLLFDIDDFKRYNDTYGHAAGDDILREIARLIRRTTRAQDIVARIGGDEFTVLFWDAGEPRQAGSRPLESAAVMAERFRRAVSKHEFPSLGPEARGALTISGGLASFPEDGRTCRDLLRSADAALRAAKTSGKDAIHLIGG